MNLEILNPFRSSSYKEDASLSKQGRVCFKVRDEEDEDLGDFILSLPLEFVEVLAYYILGLSGDEVFLLISRETVVRQRFIAILQLHLLNIHTLHILSYLGVRLSHLGLLACLLLLPYKDNQ